MCPTDRECVQLCLNGQTDAFRHLVLRYQHSVLAYLAGRTNGRDTAEEAAQETFVRAYCRLDRLKNPTAFYSWLLGIAGRVAHELHRTEQRHREAAAGARVEDAEPKLVGDHDLRKTVAQLPARYRRIVLLRYYGGLSCRQVAERLDMPLGTVTKVLSRAHAKLRESLRSLADGD